MLLDLERTEFTNTIIGDLLGHSRAGVTKVYARGTRAVLEQAVEKLTEPWGQVIEFERRAG